MSFSNPNCFINPHLTWSEVAKLLQIQWDATRQCLTFLEIIFIVSLNFPAMTRQRHCNLLNGRNTICLIFPANRRQRQTSWSLCVHLTSVWFIIVTSNSKHIFTVFYQFVPSEQKVETDILLWSEIAFEAYVVNSHYSMGDHMLLSNSSKQLCLSNSISPLAWKQITHPACFFYTQ